MSFYTKTQREGYNVKEKTLGRSSIKLPFFCPRAECGRITDSLDDEYLCKYGICAVCYITCIEDRKKPLIDIKQYCA